MSPKVTAVVAVAILLFSCTKNDDPTPQPVYNQSFEWTFGGTPHVADSSMAHLNSGTNKPTIIAWNKGSAVGTYKIGFKVNSLDVDDSYVFIITASGYYPPEPTDYSNFLYYYDDNGNELPVINGAVNILSNKDGRISGDFTANLLDAGGVNKHLAGRFKDVPIKP